MVVQLYSHAHDEGRVREKIRARDYAIEVFDRVDGILSQQASTTLPFTYRYTP